MDKGQKETEAILKKVENRINIEYAKAIEDIEDEMTQYLARFKKKDETWRRWVEEGKKTAEEYEKWRVGQMAVGERWEAQKDILATELVNANNMAKSIVNNNAPQIFADNFNFATYQVEKDAKINTSFTLYSRDSVARLIAEDPDVLPGPGKKVSQAIAEGKAFRWDKQQLQSVMIQGILQGDSIPKLATRLATTVGDRDRKAAIRNARTMATRAQNAGRVNAYKRAQDKGVDLEQMWLATLDGRTRHSHRWIDREVRPIGEEFSNGCEYPGDPKGAPEEIYNCRCSLRGIVKGLERRAYKYRDPSGMEGMSYEEWKNAKANSNPITQGEETQKAIKQSYINEYRYGDKDITKGGIVNNYTGEEELNKSLANTYESHRVLNNLDVTPYEEGFTSVNLDKLSDESAHHISDTLVKLMDEYDTSLRHVRTLEGEEEKMYAFGTGAWAFTAHDYRMGESVIVINEYKCGNYEKMIEGLQINREKKKCINFADGKEGEYIATHEFAHSIFNVGEKLPTKKENWIKADYTKLKEVRKETERLFNEYKAELSTAEKKWMEVEAEATRTFDLRKWEEAAKLREEYDKLFISKYALTDVDEFMAESFAASRIGTTQNEYTEAIGKLIKDNYGR